IAKAARAYGMRVRAVTLKENSFQKVSLPAIIHWEFNHFVVVERWSPTSVDLVDPAQGRRTVTAEEFDEGFTGIVLMLEPGIQFERRAARSPMRVSTYFRQFLKVAPLAFAQLLGASLLLQIFGLITPLITQIVVDRIIPQNLSNILPVLGIGLLILVFSQMVTTLLRASVLVYLQTRVDTHMMFSFFEKLLQVSLRFFQVRTSGDILSRLGS